MMVEEGRKEGRKALKLKTNQHHQIIKSDNQSSGLWIYVLLGDNIETWYMRRGYKPQYLVFQTHRYEMNQ